MTNVSAVGGAGSRSKFVSYVDKLLSKGRPLTRREKEVLRDYRKSALYGAGNSSLSEPVQDRVNKIEKLFGVRSFRNAGSASAEGSATTVPDVKDLGDHSFDLDGLVDKIHSKGSFSVNSHWGSWRGSISGSPNFVGGGAEEHLPYDRTPLTRLRSPSLGAGFTGGYLDRFDSTALKPAFNQANQKKVQAISDFLKSHGLQVSVYERDGSFNAELVASTDYAGKIHTIEVKKGENLLSTISATGEDRDSAILNLINELDRKTLVLNATRDDRSEIAVSYITLLTKMLIEDVENIKLKLEVIPHPPNERALDGSRGSGYQELDTPSFNSPVDPSHLLNDNNVLALGLDKFAASVFAKSNGDPANLEPSAPGQRKG